MVRFFFSQKACGPTRDGSCSPCVGRWSLNRWTAREVPRQRSFTFSFHLRWASFVCPFDRLSLLLCPARWLLGVACPAPRVGGVQSVLPAGAQREERPGTPSLPAGGSCPSSEVTAPGGSSSLQSRFHPWFAVTSPFPWHLSQGPGACPRPHPGVLHALGCPHPRLCGLSRTQLLCAVSCSLHCSTDPLPQTWSFSGTPVQFSSVQFSSVTQSCPTLCDPIDCSTPGFPVLHQLLELAQTHVCWVGDAIQPSHPLSSPSPLSSRFPSFPESGSFQGLHRALNGGEECSQSLGEECRVYMTRLRVANHTIHSSLGCYQTRVLISPFHWNVQLRWGGLYVIIASP